MDSDRQRLKDIHQSDLTEGRVNVEFLEWLKTKGMSWLLVLLLGLCAYFAVVRWKTYREEYRTQAWADLESARTSGSPGKLEEVAETYSEVGAVPHLARLNAAIQLLGGVQIDQTVGATAADRLPLSHEDREQYLARADRLAEKVLESDDNSVAMTTLAFQALSARAAVAECRGDTEKSRQLYEQAAQRVEAQFPALAALARQRAASTGDYDHLVALPTEEEVRGIRQAQPSTPLDPLPLEPWVREIIMTEQSGGS